MFGAQNNYVAPLTPPSLVTNGLLLYLNAILDYPFSDYKKISRIKNSLELINNNYLAN